MECRVTNDAVFSHPSQLKSNSLYLADRNFPTTTKMTGKSDFEALSRRIEALEAKVGGARGQTVLPYLVDYSNDLGNSVAGNDRIVPLLKRLEELETFLDPLYAEKEASSLGVKMSLVESQHNTVKENQELLGGYRLQ